MDPLQISKLDLVSVSTSLAASQVSARMTGPQLKLERCQKPGRRKLLPSKNEINVPRVSRPSSLKFTCAEC